MLQRVLFQALPYVRGPLQRLPEPAAHGRQAAQRLQLRHVREHSLEHFQGPAVHGSG